MIIPVIVSGGVGSRLWPASRKSHPKPFLVVENGKSLLLNTYERAASFDGVTDIVTVTAKQSSFNTAAEYALFKSEAITNHLLLEPMPRDTAAAAATATRYVGTTFGNNAIMLFLAADHVIRDADAFQSSVSQAVERARDGKIVTFGIRPDRPETGYGYIEIDGEQAIQFHEKPDLETARRYLANGNYLWNSGMFCFAAGTMAGTMEVHCPQVLNASTRAIESGRKIHLNERLIEVELDAGMFSQAEKISVDYAVMEKTKDLAVVSADIGWSDVGDWASLSSCYASDEEGNATTGDTALVNAKDCFVSSEGRLIGIVGMENIAVIDTRDATLVVDKTRSQDVKKLFEKLSLDDHPAHESFPTGFRPWGSYTILDEGPGYKVKRIEVKPGGCLSLQSHKHRAEHWTVVSGEAHVVNGDENLVLRANQSTYIERGNVHRMENRGEEPMTLIEVQTGTYLGEDDIVRYEDIYGRS
ncbi:MAG: mannose-1-phosphate guanylyltransferase/mannose-6-phosphate isomerase [Pseudomonadota bacterium]